MFCSDSYVVDVNNVFWSVVCNEEQTDAAFDTFMKLLSQLLISTHPLRT
jgi:hypothetical protein